MSLPTCPTCIYAQGICEKTGVKIRYSTGCSYHKLKPMTNADRLRSMSDEELAKWLDLLVNRAKIYGENKVWLEDTPRYYTDWLGWLKQEAKE